MNQSVSFKFGAIQLLDIMNLLGGALNNGSFLKAYKLQRQKDFSTTNDLITPTKSRRQNFPRMMLSTVNFAAVNLLKSISRTTLMFWKLD